MSSEKRPNVSAGLLRAGRWLVLLCEQVSCRDKSSLTASLCNEWPAKDAESPAAQFVSFVVGEEGRNERGRVVDGVDIGKLALHFNASLSAHGLSIVVCHMVCGNGFLVHTHRL